jgi:hypothetical protein
MQPWSLWQNLVSFAIKETLFILLEMTNGKTTNMIALIPTRITQYNYKFYAPRRNVILESSVRWQLKAAHAQIAKGRGVRNIHGFRVNGWGSKNKWGRGITGRRRGFMQTNNAMYSDTLFCPCMSRRWPWNWFLRVVSSVTIRSLMWHSNALARFVRIISKKLILLHCRASTLSHSDRERSELPDTNITHFS